MSTTSGNSAPTSKRPVHAPLTDVPVGAVVVAAVFDVISTAGGDTRDWARDVFRAGTFTLMVGTSFMVLAVLAGFVDRARSSRPRSSTRTAINVHAATMTFVAVLSVADIALRRNHYGSALHTPVAVLILTLATLTVTVVGAMLGGKLVYRRGVGVSPSPAATGGLRIDPDAERSAVTKARVEPRPR